MTVNLDEITAHGVRIHQLTHADIQEVQRCFSHVFRTNEPMAAALDFTDHEFAPCTEMIVARAAQEGLSLVVKDQVTDKVLGFSIGQDYQFSEEVLVPPELSPKFHHIFRLIGDLDQKYMAKREIAGKRFFHHHAAGLDFTDACEDIEKGLIAKLLYQRTFEIAEQQQFDVIIGHASSSFAQRFYTQFGFESVEQAFYKNYEVFKNIRWHRSCEFCERIIR